MKNMSEECVKALLDYVYCRRLEKAVNNFEIALNLLKASFKYELEDLKENMKEIFMWKRSDDFVWFSIKNSIKLFLLAKNLEEVDNLRDKAVRVLKK